MLYRVTDSKGLELLQDIELKGKPVAICPTLDRLYVLVRPKNDARHSEEGWVEAFDFAGKSVGSKFLVGLYPDDLALNSRGDRAYVLTSGRGEGEPNRPLPTLSVYDLQTNPTRPEVVGQLAFDQPGDDPSRLAISVDVRTAAVSLQVSNAVAWVDLAELDHPKLLARTAWPKGSSPDAIQFDHLGGLLAADEGNEALWHQAGPTAEPTTRPIIGGIGDAIEIAGSPDYWAMSLPFDSGIALLPAGSKPEGSLSRLPLKGRANLASTRPLGVAYNPDRSLLAVANRSGGSVHLIAVDLRK